MSKHDELTKEIEASAELLRSVDATFARTRKVHGVPAVIEAKKRRIVLAFTLNKARQHLCIHADVPKELEQWRGALERARTQFGTAYHAMLNSEGLAN